MPDSLITHAERIAMPPDYFRGRAEDTLPRPQNVLCFLRRTINGDQYSRHGRHVLIICLAGPGEMGAGGQILRLEVNHCILVPPFRPHYYFVGDQDLRWLFVTFDLPEDAAPLTTLCEHPMSLDDLDQAILADLVAAWNADRRVDLALTYLLHRLASRHRRRRSPQPIDQPAGDDVVDRVTQRIYADMKGLPGIDELAASIGLSGGHLRSIFRRRYGTSLGAYISEARLQEAARLLRRTRRRVSEVAADVGFESPFAFSRAFSRRFGTSPRAWRGSDH